MHNGFEPEFRDAYKISLDVYSGPLDLLLTLIRRAEVDIYNIPVAEIAEQYLQYVSQLQDVNLEDASEFLVLAAMLIEIKSQMLLPGSTDDADEDPRLELVQKLLEYKKYRDLGITLGEQLASELKRYSRPAGLLIDDSPRELNLDEIDVWDLYQRYKELEEQLSLDWKTIVYDDVPIENLMDTIRRILRESPKMPVEFSECLKQYDDRFARIGMFIALLELVRLQEIEVEQDEKGLIYLRLKKAENSDRTE